MHSVECLGLQVAFIVLSFMIAHAFLEYTDVPSGHMPSDCLRNHTNCLRNHTNCCSVHSLGHGVHMTCSFPLIDLGTPTNTYCNFIFTLLDLSQLLHVGGTFYSHNVEDVFSVCCRHRHWFIASDP